MKAEKLETPSTPDITTYVAERRALLSATQRIVGAPDRVAVFRNDEERQLAVIEAAGEVRDVIRLSYPTHHAYEVAMETAQLHLVRALDALTGGTDD